MIGDENTQPNETPDPIDELADALGGEPETEEQADAQPNPSEDGDGEERDDEPEPEADEEADEPVKTKYTITHDGKEVELDLTPDETKAMLQQSFDYSKKTMALAEERKAIEPLKREAEQFRQQANEAMTEAVNRLDSYAKFLQSQVGDPPPISLASTDAGKFLAQKELYEARKGQLDRVLSESRALVDEQARQRQAYVNHKAAQAEKVLKDTLPGWNDAMLTDLAGYAETLGLNPGSAELAMLEPGFWQLAQKAKAYDEIKATAAKAKPRAAITQVAKPGAANPIGKAAAHAKRLAEFDKNPSVDALAKLIG